VLLFLRHQPFRIHIEKSLNYRFPLRLRAVSVAKNRKVPSRLNKQVKSPRFYVYDDSLASIWMVRAA